MSYEEAARAVREFGETARRVWPVMEPLIALHVAYEAERAAAHFEGRVPPSIEVWYAERRL